MRSNHLSYEPETAFVVNSFQGRFAKTIANIQRAQRTLVRTRELEIDGKEGKRRRRQVVAIVSKRCPDMTDVVMDRRHHP